MKQMIFLLLAVPMTLLTGQGSLGSMTQAISQGDSATLGQYFDNTVEIAVLDKEDLYTRSEAEGILKGFFRTHSPRSFSQVHKGASKGKDSLYCIGNLVTNSDTFRVYIYMRVSGDSYVIQELRFDKE